MIVTDVWRVLVRTGHLPPSMDKAGRKIQAPMSRDVQVARKREKALFDEHGMSAPPRVRQYEWDAIVACVARDGLA